MELNIIPMPQKLEPRKGDFVLTGNTAVRCPESLAALGDHLQTIISDGCGAKNTLDAPSEISIAINQSLAGLGEEGYVLEVQPSRISIESSASSGIFYGIQTLRQLVLRSRGTGCGGKLCIPCVKIEDWPAFAWRGMMLDEGRHFFGKDFVKKFIDLMALFKMNSFHWHLTDDQGWRIEIKKYPKLTEIGSRRAESPIEGNRDEGDGRPYGGFYTQRDIREIVEYAASRCIRVVPEIEMPGHAAAAIASYPEFGNKDIPDYRPEVKTRWGIHYYTFSPTESTFGFLEDVLSEVIDLFPGKYLHVGGDEAPKDQWKQSAAAQKVIAENDLRDEHGLQSYFIRRIEGFLRKKNRILIGWDEIQEGGLSKTATMMVWRDWKWADFALDRGNCVVMAPTSHTYFDYYQADNVKFKEPEAIGGLLTLEKVYAFDPVPAGLPEEKRKLVLGAQAQLWAEYLFDEKKVEYMAFPRMLALAEAVWTSSSQRSYDDFLSRLNNGGLAILDSFNVNYRRP